jgi:molybdopterin/thiamine biosynthesis adenylyltransferase
MNTVIDYNRQMGIINQNHFDKPLVLIGAGGIGSPTALALCKMGLKEIIVYDDDKVEPHNLPNQIYRKNDIGKLKVEALKDMCLEFSDIKFTAIPRKFDGDLPERCVVVSGVDSMAARIDIWKSLRFNSMASLYVDGRMGKEMVKIYRVNPTNMDSIKEYEESLVISEDNTPIPCTEKAVIYNVFFISSMIAHAVRCHYTEQSYVYKDMFYDFNSGLMMYDTPL